MYTYRDVVVGDALIQPYPFTKFLGVFIDDIKVSFLKHINTYVAKYSRRLF